MLEEKDVDSIVRACLQNAGSLLEAAKRVAKPGSNHIAYHLGVAALPGFLAFSLAVDSCLTLRAFLVAPPNFKRKEFPAPSFTKVPESAVPYPTLVVASTNDLYCPVEVAAGLANNWGGGFVSVGPRGHISTEPGNGDWQEGWNLLEAFAAGLRVQI